VYRDGTEILTVTRMNFVLAHSALGDMITSLPAVIHARRTHGNRLKMHVWVPPWQMELVEYLLKPYGEFIIQDYGEFQANRAGREGSDLGPVAINAAHYNTHTRNRVHMVDYAFNYLLDARPETMAQRNYPNAAPLGPRVIAGPYVVFPVGATSDNKLFRASVMVPIMRWVLERGYKPVLLGTKTSHVKAEVNGELEPVVVRDEADRIPQDMMAQAVDYRERTTLLQARDVCGHAAATVGVDGGTLHLAGTTNAPIVYGLTTTVPAHRYITRNAEPGYRIRYVVPRDLACAGCQSQWTLLFRHDFRYCPYGDYACTEKLHPEDFINGLKELGL